MAPTGFQYIFRIRRDASGASASTVSASLYLGLGIGVGGAILLAVIIVTVQIVKKRKEHRRLLEALEVEQAVQVARMQNIADVPRPASVARCSTLMPLHSRAGWGALASDETVNEPTSSSANKKKLASVSLPKRIKQRGIPLKRLKRLTAIMESPRSKNTASPILQCPDPLPIPGATEHTASTATKSKVDSEGVFVCPGSPKVQVLPSFAIRSPGRYGAGIANSDNTKAVRSRSVGALMVPVYADDVFQGPARHIRPPMHSRSISLGAPISRPPSGPVPPLPVIAPHSEEVQAATQEAGDLSRRSSSSRESTSSSVLVTSPILNLNEQNQAVSSPTVEKLVAKDDSASLKTVSKKQWQNPVVAKSRSQQATAGAHHAGAESQFSIRSNIAHFSVGSVYSRRQSNVSTDCHEQPDKKATVQVSTADQISLSRVSSHNSLNSNTSIRKVTTPRKASRTSVSVYGSPAERRKTSVLRDISANSITPRRQPSNATQDSGHSSNGNPFQWDTQPLAKPSALKGSPNARKGHRRQNCVRISTLTPQILGPPPSRPTSPSIMHGIEEESGDGEDAAADPNKLKFVSNHRLSRPPSASSLVPNLRIQTLRASLTPSSPTLSAWTAFQEHGLPSQNSDSQLSVSQQSASPATITTSRQSNHSSNFSIPSFPSPIKPSVSDVQLSQPVPQFYLSRPSTDIADSDESSPFTLTNKSNLHMPSSPPMSTSKTNEYDPTHPAWPAVAIPAPRGKEYDPASPTWDTTEPERSSPLFPFAANALNHARTSEEVSPRSRPTSYGGDVPDTPPCSPKTMPEGFQAFFDKQSTNGRAAEKLTSANASSIMANMPTKPVDFPGAPVLPPPAEPEAYNQTTPLRASGGAFYHPMRFQPMRPAPPPPKLDTLLLSSSPAMPSPLHIEPNPSTSTTKPIGPRKQPANSVLKNAIALRRMNSEVNSLSFPSSSHDHSPQSRESRRYVRLGREASPLLPWTGSPDPADADMNELFDFGFASAEGGAEDYEGDDVGGSVMDEVDMTEVERKLDGAIAGFRAADSSTAEARVCSSVYDASSRVVSSVWDDGEKYWESSPPLSESTPTRHDGYRDVTFEGVVWDRTATPRSIQCTPKSLYDSDGFLRT